jgi:hypothetical protein
MPVRTAFCSTAKVAYACALSASLGQKAGGDASGNNRKVG